MGKKIITFDDIEVEKHKFHHHKNIIFVRRFRYEKNAGVEYISLGQKNAKYFVGYKDDDDHKIKQLRTMLPKTSAYVKSYDEETKWMHFSIKHDELLVKYNGIWNRFSNSINKELDCEPIYNKKFLKSKIRSYDHEATDFHDHEIPKVGSNCTCLAVILTDFVFKKDESYYPQVFSKECK